MIEIQVTLIGVNEILIKLILKNSTTDWQVTNYSLGVFVMTRW